MKNILISGRPGIGKTTLIRKVADSLKDRAGGFYTGEIRRQGARTGFSLTTLDGKSGVLATVGGSGPHRVGKYTVHLTDLENIGVPAVLEAVESGKVVVIDEIARMELFSDRFKQAVTTALDSDSSVVATIQQRHDPFLDSVRSRQDVELVELTTANRECLSWDIMSMLGA